MKTEKEITLTLEKLKQRRTSWGTEKEMIEFLVLEGQRKALKWVLDDNEVKKHERTKSRAA